MRCLFPGLRDNCSDLVVCDDPCYCGYPLLIEGHHLTFVVGEKNLRITVTAEILPSSDLAEEFVSAVWTLVHDDFTSYLLIVDILHLIFYLSSEMFSF